MCPERQPGLPGDIDVDGPGGPGREVADVGQDATGAAGGPTAGARPSLPLPDKPSIAVLPFTNLSDDPEQDYFADGIVEDIITGLSRIKWVFVIARNSSFAYKGKAMDVKQVGRELGVRYVLEGSVRRSGNRVRITAQLIDAGPAPTSGPTTTTVRSTTSSRSRTS